MNQTITREPRKMIPWIIYLIFFAVLNETVFNVSTPMIARDFTLTASGVSWMMTIFMVFFGIGSVIYGKLADIFSLKALISIGIAIYSLGSLMGFVLQFSYPMVIIARAIQGIGGSAIPALVFVAVARYFDDDQRGRIFGTITAVVSVAIGIGPVIGGFVSGQLHWAWLFIIPLLSLIALPFLNKLLPSEPRGKGSVDFPGAILVAMTVGSLVLYLNFDAWYYLAGFIAGLALFIVRIRMAADPFIQPALFRNVKFRSGVIVGFCLFSIVLGTMFLIPLMLNSVHHLEPSQIGLVLFPGAISSVVFGPIAGTLADRRGNSFVVSLGLGLLLTSLLSMALFLNLSPIAVGAALLLTFIGFSLFQTAMINSISQTLPAEETGVGMGLFNLVSIISGAVGTALVGKILTGGWLDHNFLAPQAGGTGLAYSNLLVIFALIVIIGGAVYLRAYRKTRSKEPQANPEMTTGSSPIDGCLDRLPGLEPSPDCP